MKDIDFESVLGRPIYLAPEFLKGRNNAGFPVDVYSYSIFLYRLFKPDIQFDYKVDSKSFKFMYLFKRILKGGRFVKPKNIPQVLWDLIQRCWKQNPKERLTFDHKVTELKNNKYVLDEFGVKTDLKELHEYQNRVENYKQVYDEFSHNLRNLYK